jgi:hypothetical protein
MSEIASLYLSVVLATVFVAAIIVAIDGMIRNKKLRDTIDKCREFGYIDEGVVLHPDYLRGGSIAATTILRRMDQKACELAEGAYSRGLASEPRTLNGGIDWLVDKIETTTELRAAIQRGIIARAERRLAELKQQQEEEKS